ncbi:MAG: hypothetical protein LW832_06610 [Parachlamydia sp.]|jgi:hypothetical protein|nr:hypothetical protein [Parachlamydia sp.]
MNKLILLFILLSCTLQGENWINDWFDARQHMKKNEMVQAIDKYTQAIANFRQAAPYHEFHLYLERGNAYAKSTPNEGQNIQNGIADYTYIIDHANAPVTEKANALWHRSQAYIKSQQMVEARNDLNALERLQPLYIVSHHQEGNYIVFKSSERMRVDITIKNGFVQMLLNKGFIDTREDFVLTEEGMGIIKKSSRAPHLPLLGNN